MNGQGQDVVGADIVELAKRSKVSDRHFIDAIFIPGIHLLGCTENMSNGTLLEITIFPQFAEYFPIFFHIRCEPFNKDIHEKYMYTISGVLTNTPKVVYNCLGNINRKE